MQTITLLVSCIFGQADQGITLAKTAIAAHQNYRMAITQGRIQFTFRTGFGKFDEAKGTVTWAESANGWPGLNVGSGIFIFRGRNAIWRKDFDNDTKDKCTISLPGGRVSTFEAIDEEYHTDGANTINRFHMFDKLRKKTDVNPQFILSKGPREFYKSCPIPFDLGLRNPVGPPFVTPTTLDLTRCKAESKTDNRVELILDNDGLTYNRIEFETNSGAMLSSRNSRTLNECHYLEFTDFPGKVRFPKRTVRIWRDSKKKADEVAGIRETEIIAADFAKPVTDDELTVKSDVAMNVYDPQAKLLMRVGKSISLAGSADFRLSKETNYVPVER